MRNPADIAQSFIEPALRTCSHLSVSFRNAVNNGAIRDWANDPMQSGMGQPTMKPGMAEATMKSECFCPVALAVAQLKAESGLFKPTGQ